MNKQRNGVIFSYNSLYLRHGMMTCTRPEARSLCLSSPQSLPQVLVLVGKHSVTELHAAAAVGGGMERLPSALARWRIKVENQGGESGWRERSRLNRRSSCCNYYYVRVWNVRVLVCMTRTGSSTGQGVRAQTCGGRSGLLSCGFIFLFSAGEASAPPRCALEPVPGARTTPPGPPSSRANATGRGICPVCAVARPPSCLRPARRAPSKQQPD